jgi:hypothetical protein
MNSPASQKLPEASAVAIYTKQAIAQMIQPVMLLTFLKFIQSDGGFKSLTFFKDRQK